jgi:hypothetical protein
MITQAAAVPATGASIESQPTLTNVQRAGINLGEETYYGPSWFRANVLENPGFEPVESGRVIEATNPTADSFCETSNAYLFPPNFYVGATFEVVYSAKVANVGASGKVTGYDPTGIGCSNANPYWSYAASFVIQPGDILVTHSIGNLPSSAEGCTASPGCGPAAMWSFGNDPQWSSSTDQEPQGTGVQSLQLELDGRSHSVDYYFDPIFPDNHAYFLITGAWRFSIYSKAVAAVAPTCTATLERDGAPTYFSYTWTPGTRWSNTSVPFVGSDTLSAVSGAADLLITCSGSSGEILFDDAYLGPAATDGVWRPEVVDDLLQLHPGYLRDDQGTRADSYANLISDSTARQVTSYGGASDLHDSYSIPEFFDLNSRVGSRPWISIPVTLLDSEYTALGRTLASLQAKYNFPEILVEFGNDDTNGACGGACFNQGGNVSPMAYAAVANRAFRLVQTAAGAQANLKYVGSAQWGPSPGAADAQSIGALLPSAQFIGVAPYWDSCQDQGSIATNENDMWNDPQHGTDQSLMTSVVAALQPYNEELAFSGIGPNTLGGSDSTAGRIATLAGAGSAGVEAQTILRGLSAGVPVINSFQFTELQLSGVDNFGGVCANPPAETYVPIRGLLGFIDTPVLRPRGLALQLLNNYAIGGDFYRVDGAPSGVTVGAFLQPDGWHIALANSNATPLTVSITFPSSLKPLPKQLEQIDFLSVTDNNEGSGPPQVTIGAGGTVTVNSPVQITVPIPAYGTVVAYP